MGFLELLTHRTSDEFFPIHSHSTLHFRRLTDLNIHIPWPMRATSNAVLATSFGLNLTSNTIYYSAWLCVYSKASTLWTQWHMPVIVAGGRQRQEDYYKLEVSLSYMVWESLPKNQWDASLTLFSLATILGIGRCPSVLRYDLLS